MREGAHSDAHELAWQVSPSPQARPHAPQCSSAAVVSTQPSDPQSVCPSGHTAGARHAPLSQTIEPSHARPHSPQFIGSDCTSTHDPPHDMRPPEHVVPPSPSGTPPSIGGATEHTATPSTRCPFCSENVPRSMSD